MPNGNGMGPAGAGPMTGRAAGFCAGNGAPGRGGCGGGRGFRSGFFATGLPGWARFGGAAAAGPLPDERQTLHARADALQAQLDAVRRRMEVLEKQ